MSGIAVGLRLISKYLAERAFWFDDYAILLTLVSGIPSSVLLGQYLPRNGVGKDLWTVPFPKITTFIHIFFTVELLYFFQVACMKLSILCFYLKIFPNGRFKYILWATIIFDAVFGFIFIFAALFQCRPIQFFWTNWDGEHKGKCFNSNAMAW